MALQYAEQHSCWQQRVKREMSANQRILDYNIQCQDDYRQQAFTTPIKSYTYTNNDQNKIKQATYFTVNSSYLIPCNPNTMRDMGRPRNVEFNFDYQQNNTQRNSTSMNNQDAIRRQTCYQYSFKSPPVIETRPMSRERQKIIQANDIKGSSINKKNFATTMFTGGLTTGFKLKEKRDYLKRKLTELKSRNVGRQSGQNEMNKMDQLKIRRNNRYITRKGAMTAEI